MNGVTLQSVAPWLVSQAPVLPAAGWMQLYLQLGWSMVLLTLGFMATGRWSARLPVLRAVPWLLGAWAWVPGGYGLSYWLGLAFQAPSVTTVLLCAVWLRARWMNPSHGVSVEHHNASTWALVIAGVLLGWALVLDSLALWPLQWYAWGFSPVAPAVVLVLTLLPWVVWQGKPGQSGTGVGPWLPALAVLLFVLLRLPSGNLWDALLDPWLWLVLQGYGLRRLWICYR